MTASLSRRAAVATASALALAGCSKLGWLGDADKPKLPGTRKSVLLLEDDLKADPGLAELAVALPRPRRNEAWAQTGGVATHALYHLDVADTIRRAWGVSIGSGAGTRSRLLAAPVAAGGRVYTVDATDTVTAFAATDGRQAWRQRLKDAKSGDRLTTGGLAYDAGRLYVSGAAGTVLALDAGSGAEIWRNPLKAPIRAAPTVAEGHVLVVSADNQLTALDSATGTVRWRHSGVFEQAGILGGASPAATAGIVIAAYSSGEVFGLELASGRPLWSDTVLRPRRTLAVGTFTDIMGDPVIDRDRVIVAGVSGEMVALDIARGERIWTSTITSTQMPWAAGDFLFVLTERNEVACMLRQDGRVRWVAPLAYTADPKNPDAARIYWSGPILVGDRLLVAGTGALAMTISPYTGKVLGSTRLGGPVTLPPIAADGTVYLLTDGGELLAYR